MKPMKGAERGEVFRRGVNLLAKAGIVNPALDASVLLGHVTGEDSACVLMDRSQALTDHEEALYEKLVQRRCRRETISRLTGRKEFYSRVFYTDKNVLDPRSETEILVEKALDYLEGFCGRPKILDLGTGSGVIAITLAAENRNVIITATDISIEALKVAVYNSARHGVSDRVRFVRADLAAGLTDTARFDLVVSNPPYVSLAEYGTLSPEVLYGDPDIALVAGPEGTEFYPDLAKTAKRLLNPGGHLLVEVGMGQSHRVKACFREAGLTDLKVFRDLSGVSRVIKGTRAHG